MKGDTMRPLIEILEDERTLTQKLESIHRYMLRDDDSEVIDILMARKRAVERDLDTVHNELMDYIGNLSKHD